MSNHNIQTIRELINQAEALTPEAIHVKTESLSLKQIKLNLVKAMLEELKSVVNSPVLDEEVVE